MIRNQWALKRDIIRYWLNTKLLHYVIGDRWLTTTHCDPYYTITYWTLIIITNPHT